MRSNAIGEDFLHATWLPRFVQSILAFTRLIFCLRCEEAPKETLYPWQTVQRPDNRVQTQNGQWLEIQLVEYMRSDTVLAINLGEFNSVRRNQPGI